MNKKELRLQNLLLLLSSYYFYSCWDWRFLFLLIFSTLLDYYAGIRMHGSKNLNIKKIWFCICIAINLGFLGIFKYYDFFAITMQESLSKIGLIINVSILNIILPVGISFYTFHGLSYVIDIYKNRIIPEKNLVTYSLFVSYFPLLVAGPIERATHLLPQIKKARNFDLEKAKDGIHQIIWGLFKKMVIADSCAVYANQIFDNYQDMNSISLIFGAVYFAFQIYGDFSGYSDIALGVSKLFGIDLLRNFNFPYFSRDIAEFWRRWHISLSSWFRDYLYIPLGGSKGGLKNKIRNTFIIFLVSGFWHGANLTFIVWGALNAIYFMPLLITNSNRNNLDIVAKDKTLPSALDFFRILKTFSLTVFAWIFFRSKSVNDAFLYIKKIFEFNFDEKIQYLSIDRYSVELVILIFSFVIFEWISRENEHPFFGKFKNFRLFLVFLGILLFGVYSEVNSFIYFQF